LNEQMIERDWWWNEWMIKIIIMISCLSNPQNHVQP
jgi:hypothetical protein